MSKADLSLDCVKFGPEILNLFLAEKWSFLLFLLYVCFFVFCLLQLYPIFA